MVGVGGRADQVRGVAEEGNAKAIAGSRDGVGREGPVGGGREKKERKTLRRDSKREEGIEARAGLRKKEWQR